MARVVGRLREAARLLDVRHRDEIVVAVVVPDLAMEPVAAGLRDHVDLGAAVAAELDAVGVRLDLELGHRLRHDLRRGDSHRDVVVVRAVDHVVVVARTLAVGRVGALARHPAHVRRGSDEVVDVAIGGERQLDHLALQRRGANGPVRLVELDRLGPAQDGDGLAHASHLHLDVDRGFARGDEANVIVLHGLEAAELGTDLVRARLECWYAVEAVRVAHRAAALVRVDVRHRNGGARDERTAGIAHRARDGAARHLCCSDALESQEPDEREESLPRSEFHEFTSKKTRLGDEGSPGSGHVRLVSSRRAS